MDYVNLILQLFFAGILMYIIVRVLDLELRLNSIEKVLEAIPVYQPPPPPSQAAAAPSSPRGVAGTTYLQEEEEDGEGRQDDDVLLDMRGEPHLTSEINNEYRLIEPQHFDSTEDLSARLKKMSLGQLTDIASEKKIDLSQESNSKKKITKKVLVEKIMAASRKTSEGESIDG